MVVIDSANKSLPRVMRGREVIINERGGKLSIVLPPLESVIIDDGSRRNRRIYYIQPLSIWGEETP